MFNSPCAVPLYVLYHIQYRFLKVGMNYLRSGEKQASTRALRSMARGHLDIHLCLVSLRVLSKLEQTPKQSVYKLTILSYPEAFTPSHPGNGHDDILGATTVRSTSMGVKNDAKMKAQNNQSPTPTLATARRVTCSFANLLIFCDYAGRTTKFAPAKSLRFFELFLELSLFEFRFTVFFPLGCGVDS